MVCPKDVERAKKDCKGLLIRPFIITESMFGRNGEIVELPVGYPGVAIRLANVKCRLLMKTELQRKIRRGLCNLRRSSETASS